MIIKSKRVYIDDEFKACALKIENKKIVSILDYDTDADIDYINDRILPGFYDTHSHGFKGYDTNDAKEDGLREWIKEITKQGVCGLCPTTITQSKVVLTNALKSVYDLSLKDYEGARILGCHLEGPYISKEFKGAQPEEYIVKPDINEFKEYQKAAGGLIKIVTIAPEEDKDHELIKYLNKTGVVASLGHSAATLKEAQSAINDGACSFTHTYNGMSRFSHHSPNLVGASLSSDCFAECICDLHHSDIACVKIFFRCKGKNAIMVTDGLMTRGLPIGTKTLFGGQWVEVIEDGTCRMCDTGNFAGSTLSLNVGLKNLVEIVGVPFEEAISSCTSAPARLLKIDDHKGYIKENYDADLVVLNDNYDVINTFVEGKKY